MVKLLFITVFNSLIIFLAVQSGDVQLIELLIQNNAKIRVTDKNHLTPLHYAAFFDLPFSAKLLIDAGANLNDVFVILITFLGNS